MEKTFNSFGKFKLSANIKRHEMYTNEVHTIIDCSERSLLMFGAELIDVRSAIYCLNTFQDSHSKV